MLFLMISTAVVDVIWIFYWGNSWKGSDDDSWMNVLHQMVFIASIIELLVKIPTILLILVTEKENLIENLPEALSNIARKI